MKIFSFLPIFYLSLHLSFSIGTETDQQALLAFKSQITQDPQRVLASWNNSNSFCSWEGVTCGRKHQRVTVLKLQSKGLLGTISPHIGNLSFLRKLDLQNNTFHGGIPQEVSKLSRLRLLYLSFNKLLGEIPISLSNCSNLLRIAVGHNFLVGTIPTELGSLLKLDILLLENNNLTGEIPPSLGNLTSLENLSLGLNMLSGSVPTSLGRLKILNLLTLGPNRLSGEFPSSIYNISTLEIISIPENKLTGKLPSQIGFMLPNLQRFLVGGNRFSGRIPASMFNASKLTMFEISTNDFVGEVPLNVGSLNDLELLGLEVNDLGSGKPGDLDFLTPLTNCTKLQDLSIYTNRFGGVLPTTIGNFSDQLSSLLIGQNQISGNIPSGIGNLRSLYRLSLPSNLFTGSIPVEFQNLQKLQLLDLGYNQLSGHVPSFIGNMSQLYSLLLQYNSLDGSIAWILDNQVLPIADLSYNNFTGTIPKEIGLLSSLVILNLTHNSLNGSIPMEVGRLKYLQYFSVSENKMSGEVPNEFISGCSSMVELYLQGNTFEGPLPSSFIQGLQSLDVSRNNLSGIIPKELAELRSLTMLNLSYNKFEGGVPIEGIFRNASAISVVGNQKMCGGIPKLGLRKCEIRRPKRRGNHLAFKLILGILIPLFVVGFLLLLYLRKKPKVKTPAEEERIGDLRRISYNDLHKATNGFSSENLIGRGSYGSVYKGILDPDEGYVAIKVFNLMEHGAAKTFLSECEALRAVRHRNLLKILTVCSSEDFSGKDFKALVFEFMPNGSLDSWLHPSSDGQSIARTLNFVQRLNIATDVAFALDYLHNSYGRPIAHCDLKPSNVLLNDDLTAFVGDFGLMKFLSSGTSTSNQNGTISNAIRGTIGYIPPEYGTGAEVSTQGDMYSYGILLLEMFTGKRPTDHMFKDGLRLHDFSKTALSQGVMDIVDPRLQPEQTLNEASKSINRTEECLSSIIELGVACSMDIMTARMEIKDVIKELHSIKDTFLRV